MLTREDVESYLLRLEHDLEEVEPGMWLVQTGTEDLRIVVHYTPPLLLLRLKVMEIPRDPQRNGELYRRLLELNAVDLVHGAYGIEEGDIILTDSLELENLDFNELQASLDSIQLAVASHRETLTPYRDLQDTDKQVEVGG